MENFRLPDGKTIPAYKFFSIRDMVEEALYPITQYLNLVDNDGLEDSSPEAIVDVLKILFSSVERKIINRIDAAEGQVGKVRTLFARGDQDIVPVHKFLSAEITPADTEDEAPPDSEPDTPEHLTSGVERAAEILNRLVICQLSKNLGEILDGEDEIVRDRVLAKVSSLFADILDEIAEPVGGTA